MQIGSNTKDFTAVAIPQLKDRGLLDIGDRLGRFFPSAPPDKQKITIGQLLDHAAGFPLATFAALHCGWVSEINIMIDRTDARD